jgi:hypothetical protein
MQWGNYDRAAAEPSIALSQRARRTSIGEIFVKLFARDQYARRRIAVGREIVLAVPFLVLAEIVNPVF